MTDQFGGGKPGFKFGKDDLQLSDYELTLAAKILRPETMLQIDDRFIGYLAERLVLSGLNLPISQIQGFSGFSAQFDEITTDENLSNQMTYTDLATVGPSLDDLENGLYAVTHGSVIAGTALTPYYMSLSINGASATDALACWHRNGDETSVSRGNLITLSDDTNTIVAKYRTGDASTGGWQNRWLQAIKISNL